MNTKQMIEGEVRSFKQIYMDGDSPIEDADVVLDLADYIRHLLTKHEAAVLKRVREQVKTYHHPDGYYEDDEGFEMMRKGIFEMLTADLLRANKDV